MIFMYIVLGVITCQFFATEVETNEYLEGANV